MAWSDMQSLLYKTCMRYKFYSERRDEEGNLEDLREGFDDASIFIAVNLYCIN